MEKTSTSSSSSSFSCSVTFSSDIFTRFSLPLGLGDRERFFPPFEGVGGLGELAYRNKNQKII